ncbi:hypothetical protein AAE478_009762 [Parahypoxylon ruwenzoriense]
MAAAAASVYPRVGVAALIRNARGQFVLGRRKGSHGAGTWAFPGGHLEMGESLCGCAERETLEETGLRVTGLRTVAVTNDVFDPASKHYITVFIVCRMANERDQPEVLEPDKCEGWHWKSWEEIRQWCEHHDDGVTPEWARNKCFLAIRNLVKDYPQIDSLIS